MTTGQMGLAVFAAFVVGTALAEGINGLHRWLDRRQARRKRGRQMRQEGGERWQPSDH